MAVRVRVGITRATSSRSRVIETVAVANSGFEARDPEILLPVRAAERLGLWPPPAGAHAERFESPAASFSMITIPGAVRVSLSGSVRGTRCTVVVSERETEVVLNDQLVDALRIELVAPGRGLYRVGRHGRLRRTEEPEPW
jgi:hypothetical protein